MLPNWKKWQKEGKARIVNKTPRVKPEHSDVEIRGISEEFDPKEARGTSQIKTINVSPMFGPDIVGQYTARNGSEAYSPDVAIETVDAAEALTEIQVVAHDINFMIGCDHEWGFSDYDGPPAAGPEQDLFYEQPVLALARALVDIYL